MWYLNNEPVGNTVIIGDRRIVNPTREQYLAAGCEERDPVSQEQQEQASEEATQHVQEFSQACETFKQVCYQIRQATGLSDFTGGFDEMVAFQQTPVYSTIPGIQLALAWNAANELCKYTGSKLGYGQPEWWYRCWEEPPEEPVDDIEVVEEVPPPEEVFEDPEEISEPD